MGTSRSSRVALSLAVLVASVVLGMPRAVAARESGQESRATGHDAGRALAAVRDATAPFRRVAAAEAAGYAAFYVCTAEPGLGAMGQHYVNGALASDPAIDPLHPEALVYEPTSHGLRLVAVEYVVFQADWDARHASPPRLFGRDFGLVTAPNRYSLRSFYELHAWIWKANPAGMFFEWNPRVHCP